jgi:hypothetical protein
MPTLQSNAQWLNLKMRSLFGDVRLMLTIAILLALGGLLIGFVLKDFSWFARFGGLVVAVGITLLSRASVIGEDIRTHIAQNETGLSHLDPEHYKQTGKPIPEWVQEDRRTRKAVGVWGPFVSFIGTLIWAFGDLLNWWVVT